MHHETTNVEQLRATLDLAGLDLRASEVHGIACGEVCRELRLGSDGGFAELVGMAEPTSGAQRSVLKAVEDLMDDARRMLDAGAGFSLLLPADEEPIDERTASLADWARGFAVALLRGDRLSLDDLAGESAEFVRDLIKISEARPGERSEENERALAELEEYMRVGVQVVFEELQPDGQPGAPGPSVH